jgi:hypothetical protein
LAAATGSDYRRGPEGEFHNNMAAIPGQPRPVSAWSMIRPSKPTRWGLESERLPGWLEKKQKRGRKELRGLEGVVLRGVARNNAISAAEGPGCDGNDHNRAFCPPETNVLCQTVSF